MRIVFAAIVLALTACGGAEPMTANADLGGSGPSTSAAFGQSCTFGAGAASGCPYSDVIGGGCWIQGTITFCSVECEVPVSYDQRTRPCPTGSGCRHFGGAFGLCFNTCSAPADCPAGTACTDGLCITPGLWFPPSY